MYHYVRFIDGGKGYLVTKKRIFWFVNFGISASSYGMNIRDASTFDVVYKLMKLVLVPSVITVSVECVSSTI